MKILALLCLLAPVESWAGQTVLARLAFWVEPARIEAFAGTYAERVAPLLRSRGLVEAGERGRATPDSIFTRIFALAPGAIAERSEALGEDPEWRALLRELGPAFGAGDSLLRHSLTAYRLPAEPHRRREVGSGFRQGLWHSFGVQDGLPAASVGQVVQDRRGYLWLAMETAGLVRYDGHEFTIWDRRDGLPGDSIFDLEEDARGHLWFVTTGYTEVLEKALVRYDGEAFWIYNTADGLGDLLPHKSQSLLLNDRDGSMWVACFSRFISGTGWDAEYYKYDGRRFTRRPDLAPGGALLHEDARGDLWFATNPRGDLETDFRLTRYDGERWHAVAGPDGKQLQGVTSMLEAGDGGLWFGSHRGALRVKGAGADASFAAFAPEDGLSRGSVLGFTEDREGGIWLRTYGAEGISHYDGRRLRTFSTADGLINNQVRDIYEDRDGHMWFSTIEGVSRYDGALFTTFTTADGLANNGLMSLLEDREGRILVGAFKGYVGRYDGSGFATILPQREQAGSVWSLVEDRAGRLWATGAGPKMAPVRYDGAARPVLALPDGLSHLLSIALLLDRDGRMWIGNRPGRMADGTRTVGGLMRYADGEQVEYSVDDGLPSDQVMSLLQDRAGGIWIGTLGSGVSRFDGRDFVNLSSGDGLAHDAVWALMEDRAGGIWLGTFGGGVSRWDGEGCAGADEPCGSFTNYTSADGLAHDYVLSIVEDRRGHIWFGTFGGGVSRWDGRVFQTLAKKDGLPNNAVHQIIEDRRGDMWIATEGGLVRYRSSREAPRMRITNVIAERQHGMIDELRMPSSQEFAIFEFRGRSFTTLPDDMVYVYRLEGYDDDWRTTRARRVEYRDLPRGEYAFEVKAVDRDLNYSAPARVAVSVHWAYAQLGWAGSLALALALILWQAQRLVQRDRRLRESNGELRAEIAERERVEAERQRLDEQLERLRYLEGLRAALEGASSTEEVMRAAGEAVVEVLRAAPPGGLRVECDGRAWEFGTCGEAGQARFERTLAWGDRRRGRLVLYCGLALSEAQERALVGETAGQVERVLEARELTAQLLQSARLVSLGEMAAGVAHELNQPLAAMSAILGGIDVWLEMGEEMERDELHGKMRDALGLIERMAGTIDHLRIFSRDSVGEAGTSFSLNEVVESGLKVIGTQLHNHGIEVELALGEGLPPVYGHPMQVEQVLLNLLANARDAVDELAGGRKKMKIHTWMAEGRVGVGVEDNGPGIAEADRARLFEPFYTTKEVDKGTGLGLSISYAIVRDHGGEISFDSRIGEGSVFRVELPVSERD